MRIASKRVLVFDAKKKLVAIFHSETAAARAFNAGTQSIHCCCTGRMISCQNLYFRQLHPDVEVTIDDLGALRLKEYDDLCGATFKYYPNSKMTRVGMKYNTRKRQEQKRLRELRQQEKLLKQQQDAESTNNQQVKQ